MNNNPNAPAPEPTEAERELLQRVQRWHNDNVIDGHPCGDWHIESNPAHAILLIRAHVAAQTAEKDAEIAELKVAHAKLWIDKVSRGSRCDELQFENEQLKASVSRGDEHWKLLCRTVEAMGKIAPEAAPYADQWAAKLKAERDAAMAQVGTLKEKLEQTAHILDAIEVILVKPLTDVERQLASDQVEATAKEIRELLRSAPAATASERKE